MTGPEPERPLPPEDARSALSPEGTLDLLRHGRLEVRGRLVTASNVTLLCTVVGTDPIDGGELERPCVYKPIRGEAPLWDFPDGTLAHREVSAYRVSEETGWGIVPPTVFRDGPFGPGMVQVWIDTDPTVDVVGLVRRGDAALRPIAVFDAVVNNADRKAGHLLPTTEGHVYGVDHGVCFSTNPKLRTVLWGWRRTPLHPEEVAVLERLRTRLDGSLGADLARLLDPAEVAATARRIEDLLRDGCLPEPDPDRPAIPWPWF